MSGPKRNPDKLNTIGIVVVGICGAVLVYVSITALQAFYLNDTSEIQAHADYGGQDQTARGKKADELRNITELASNPGGAGTYRIDIKYAMERVIADAKTSPDHLTGNKLPPSTKETLPAVFGRPKMGAAATPAPPTDGAGAGSAGAGSGAGSAAPAGAGSAAPAGAGSAAPAAGSAAPQTPTGAGPGGAAGASPAAPAAAGSAGGANR